MDKRREAIKLMTHYLRLPAEAAGVNWDSDSNAEIEALVEFIIDAAVSEAVKETFRCLPTAVLE